MKSIFRPADFQALSQRLDSLRPDSPRQWGRMTAHGAVCHLTDAFKLVTGELKREGDDSHLPTPGTLVKLVGRVYALTSPLALAQGWRTHLRRRWGYRHMDHHLRQFEA